MKPSQFKRIEKAALKQREAFKSNIEKSDKLGLDLSKKDNEDNLNNLVKTMKSLKPSRKQ